MVLNFILVGCPWYSCTKTVHQYGVSIKSSTKVRETCRQITQNLWATKTWDLDNFFNILVFYNISFSWLLPLDSLRTADAFPVVASLPPTGNASAVRRLSTGRFPVYFFVAWQWKRSIKVFFYSRCHKKGFAFRSFSLALKVRVFLTRKWPISVN